ncbi:MAG: hypothetical protein ACYDD6_08495, partial [Acidimicrobiales bacterium]
MTFFDVADSSTDPRANWGLLDSADAPKPVYEAFAYWHALSPRQVPVRLYPPQSLADGIGRIGAVASTGGPHGAITVLVYDFVPFDPTGGYGMSPPTPYDHEVDLRLTGLTDPQYRWTRALVDGENAGGMVGSGQGQGPVIDIRFTLAGEGVTLLTLTPSAS